MTPVARRSMLRGAAGLFVAFSLPRAAGASGRTVAADSVDAYLAIGADGGVTVFAGKVDLGTGARAGSVRSAPAAAPKRSASAR